MRHIINNNNKIQIMGSVARKHTYTRRKLNSKILPVEQNIKMAIGLFVQYLIKYLMILIIAVVCF